MNNKQLKLDIIDAGEKAVRQLIKVAKATIIHPTKDMDVEEAELAADKMKNAAAAKKLAVFDAFEILARIEQERDIITASEQGTQTDTNVGFAERRSRA
jgi:23S rRNA pseudoU1915 N3-methylase RlmH